MSGKRETGTAVLDRIRGLRMPELPPSPKAIVPEPRRLSLYKLLRGAVKFAFWAVMLALFFAAQAGLGYLAIETPTEFPIVLMVVMVAALLIPQTNYKRWRIMLFVAFVTIMSGQLGRFFGQLYINTFLFEQLISLALVAFVVLDAYAERRKYFPPRAMVWTMLLLIAFAVASLLEVRPVDAVGGMQTTFLAVAGGIALLIGVILLFRRWTDFNAFWRVLMGTAVWAAIILLAISAISFLRIMDLTEPDVSRNRLIQLALGFGFFIAGFIYFKKWEQISTFMKVLMGGAILFSILAAIEYIFPMPFYNAYLKAFPTVGERVGRALYEHRVFGPFHNPPAFGAWLSMFVPLAAYLGLRGKTPTRRFWGWFALLLLFAAIFFTGTRMPFAAAVVGLIAFAFISGRKRLGTVGVACVVLGSAYLFLVGPQIAKFLPENNLLIRFVDPGKAKLSGNTFMATMEDARFIAWKDGYKEWQTRPITGMGIGEWFERRKLSSHEETRKVVSAYSPYLTTLVETGTLGALALVALLFLVVKWDIWALRNTPAGSRRDMVAALVAGGIIIHVVSLTDLGYDVNRIYYFFWLSQGVLLKAPYVAREELGLPMPEEEAASKPLRDEEQEPALLPEPYPA